MSTPSAVCSSSDSSRSMGSGKDRTWVVSTIGLHMHRWRVGSKQIRREAHGLATEVGVGVR
eukprot:358374-Chlamydomonas_euryale.AAC.1